MKTMKLLSVLLLLIVLLAAACGGNKKIKQPVVVPVNHLAMARAYADSGSVAFEDQNWELALAAFSEAGKHFQWADSTASEADSVGVLRERVLINQALVYSNMALENDAMSIFDSAYSEYESAIGIYKDLVPLTISPEDRDNRVADLYQNLALTAQKARHYELALEYYDKVLEYKPGNEDILKAKYQILRSDIRDIDRAYQVLLDYAIASNDYKAFLILAESYKENGDNTKAAQYYDRTLEIVQTPDVFTRVADFYRSINNFQKSNQVLEQFVATNPENDYLALAYRVMAGNYDKLKNNAKKIEFYEKSLTVERNADIALIVANHYNGVKNWDRVITYATQVISIDPNRAAAYLLRGNAYYMKKNNAAARADLTRIQNDPTYGKSASDLLKAIK